MTLGGDAYNAEMSRLHGLVPYRGTSQTCPRAIAGKQCRARGSGKPCICGYGSGPIQFDSVLDHQRRWKDSDGKPVFTSEPYNAKGADVQKWTRECEDLGMEVFKKPGVWAPHTTLFIVRKRSSGTGSQSDLTKKRKGEFCPSCATWGHEALVGLDYGKPNAVSGRVLEVGWDGVCGSCANELDAFVEGYRAPKHLHRLSKNIRASLPHPDGGGSHDRCSACDESQTFLHPAYRVWINSIKNDNSFSYGARYRCPHGHAWEVRHWDSRYVIDLIDEVWDYSTNLDPARAPKKAIALITARAKADISNMENDMQRYVRIYQDGEAVAIATTLTDEQDFNRSISTALSEFLASAKGSSEELLASALPQIVDLCCAMRGYKAPLVEKQQLLIAGRIPPRDSTLVASSEEKPEREAVTAT